MFSIATKAASSSAFSPIQLFGSTALGAWYDPSDISTMYQDSAGATPVTATGQTVGLLLDKSKGLVLGSEVFDPTWLNSSTGWTIGGGVTIASGAYTNTGTSGDAFRAVTGINPATWYEVTLTVTRTSGTLSVLCGNLLTTSPSISASGTYRLLILNSSAASNLFVLRSSTFSGAVTNISVKALPGNHASQTTAASRPIYGIEPVGGRRNFARFTEQFDNAAWASANTGGTGVAPVVTPDAALAPDGTMTADRIVFSLGGGTTTADLSRRRQVTTASDGITGTGTYSFWARTTDGASSVNILRESSDGFAGTQITVTGSWQRFTITSTTYTTGSSIGLGLRGGQTPAMPNTADILVWGAQLETGSAATAYQRVTDQWNVSEAGKASVSYLAFDGVDDFLVTGTITPGIDKAQFFAGVRKLSDAATGTVVELSASGSIGSIGVFAPIGAVANYEWRSRGTSVAQATSGNTFAAPITNVLTGIGDIANDTAILRTNGTQAATSAADQGTGNYLAYPIYIGRRGGTTLPFNGRIYQMLVRFGANLSAATITQTETFVNSRTGAY